MNFYGIEYAYGSNVVNNGGRADIVVRFDSKKTRDEWVSRGSDFVGPGERGKISARQAKGYDVCTLAEYIYT